MVEHTGIDSCFASLTSVYVALRAPQKTTQRCCFPLSGSSPYDLEEQKSRYQKAPAWFLMVEHTGIEPVTS